MQELEQRRRGRVPLAELYRSALRFVLEQLELVYATVRDSALTTTDVCELRRTPPATDGKYRLL